MTTHLAGRDDKDRETACWNLPAPMDAVSNDLNAVTCDNCWDCISLDARWIGCKHRNGAWQIMDGPMTQTAPGEWTIVGRDACFAWQKYVVIQADTELEAVMKANELPCTY